MRSHSSAVSRPAANPRQTTICTKYGHFLGLWKVNLRERFGQPLNSRAGCERRSTAARILFGRMCVQRQLTNNGPIHLGGCFTKTQTDESCSPVTAAIRSNFGNRSHDSVGLYGGQCLMKTSPVVKPQTRENHLVINPSIGLSQNVASGVFKLQDLYVYTC
jgi:hypothetical protein